MSDIVRSTVFARESATNLDRGTGGAPLEWAYRFFIEDADGNFHPAFMTKVMAAECRAIAARNPEDCGVHMPDRWRQIEAEGAGWIFVISMLMTASCSFAIGLLF